MLAMADKHGHVMASVPGLADRARVTLDQCVEALKTLSEPDEWSRSIENEGRRIEEVGGGWVLLNYTKYAKIRDEDERKEYMKNYMRKRRKQAVSNVSSVSSSKPPLADMLAHTDTDINLNPPNPPFSKPEKGGNGHRKLTPREFKRITTEVQKLQAVSVGREVPPEELLATACARAGVEFDRAKHLLNTEQT